jgi:hypothetical protein
MQLSFDFKFSEGDDEVFCCYTVPYTYSKLMKHLKAVKLSTSYILECKIAKLITIGKSLGGINIPLLKITSPEVISLA